MTGSGSRLGGSALRAWLVPGLLILCVVVVAFWEIAARRSARPFQPFDLTAEDFAAFQPRVAGWDIRPMAVKLDDPLEPNILAYEGLRDGVRVQVRLVHGYNMPMCMKIKQYDVKEITGEGLRTTDYGLQTTDYGLRSAEEARAKRIQAWLLTSPGGERSFWLTSILKAGDLGVTGVDIRTLAFPRVDVPDDPRWFPRGLTWSSLRHPIAGLRRYFRARWNAARADWLTFLRLRQPAWASEELLTYVSCSVAPALAAENEANVRARVAELHAGLLTALQTWRRQ